MEWINNFEKALNTQIKRRVPDPSLLQQALLYSIQTPGKRIRPKLAYDAAALVGLDRTLALQLGFALELVHTFSLVHDDLPCMDNDDFRRGMPTVHKKFGEAQALLVGDALFQLALECLLDMGSKVKPDYFFAGTSFFIQCVGANGIIGGQSLEFEKSGPESEVELKKVQDLKTTALFRASILTPYFWTGHQETDTVFQDALQFANAFGFAFQVADDLQDAEQDQKRANKNILSVMGVDRAKREAAAALEECKLSQHFSATLPLLQKLK